MLRRLTKHHIGRRIGSVNVKKKQYEYFLILVRTKSIFTDI